MCDALATLAQSGIEVRERESEEKEYAKEQTSFRGNAENSKEQQHLPIFN